MKEKKADLEQLLNSLIEKGWKPNGDDVKYFMEQYDPEFGGHIWSAVINEDRMEHYTYRRLTSKESGLWQFVCENGMVKEKHKHERILDPTFGEGWADCKRQEHDGNYGYRLIESALKDESELEDFLLNSIKLD